MVGLSVQTPLSSRLIQTAYCILLAEILPLQYASQPLINTRILPPPKKATPNINAYMTHSEVVSPALAKNQEFLALWSHFFSDRRGAIGVQVP